MYYQCINVTVPFLLLFPDIEHFIVNCDNYWCYYCSDRIGYYRGQSTTELVQLLWFSVRLQSSKQF